ncbi:MAG: dNTP triphosphohydrolase [Oxalobacteraceae bacterium]|nr:MAG: dNTP triphosphohydrolase [Oxalobacteraceae bacterium]
MYTEKDKSRIRFEEEKQEYGRSPFRRDFGRLLHSPAFRRLQGKTQLFPGNESDFFRNRLTHSLEVAQIAKGIAQHLNHLDPVIQKAGVQIDLDLVEFAGLAHDLGHPPFGHNGERALDECMKAHGGFEGNAQTLRILTRVERKVYEENLDVAFIHGITQDGKDARLGLNLTYRSLAAILKYDNQIASSRASGDKLSKGYYASEKLVVEKVKENVAPNHEGSFKTIECQIMDIADDIAYSTYDFEDAMKAGFTSPFEMVSRVSDPDFCSKLTKDIQKTISDVSEEEVLATVVDIVNFDGDDAILAFKLSEQIAQNSHERTRLSSGLVHQFMGGIKVLPADNMALAGIEVDRSIRLKIEALKHFSYLSIIMSSQLKVVEYRGGDIVADLFKAFTSGGAGEHLLPRDVRFMVGALRDDAEKRRVICDFVAGMTDRYAIDFYNRLYGNAGSLFRPF